MAASRGTPMNWVSILIIAVVALLTWRSYRAGFIRELVSLAAVILAIPVAGVLYDDMYPNVHPIVDNEALANLISFVSIFAGVLIAGQVLSALLKQVAEALNLGSVDHIAGGAFGFLKGVLICQALLVALVAFPAPDLREEINQSTVATRLLDGTPFVLAILPDSFEEKVDEFLDGFIRDQEDGEPGSGSTATPTPEP